MFDLLPMASKALASRPTMSTPARRRRVVTWSVPAGTHGLLGDTFTGGLVWLLGVRRPGDALAIVLRRAMSIDAEEDE
jgi:hypothetical protein